MEYRLNLIVGSKSLMVVMPKKLEPGSNPYNNNYLLYKVAQKSSSVKDEFCIIVRLAASTRIIYLIS